MYQSRGIFVFDTSHEVEQRPPVNILQPNNSVCVLFSSFMSDRF